MRLTIGRKLNGLIVTLQILSICGVVVLATQLFTSDLTGLLRKGTLDVSAMLAGRVRAEMRHVADRARILGASSLEDYKYDEDKLRFVQDNLAIDPQFVGIGLYRRGADGRFAAEWRIVSPEFTKKLKLGKEDFAQLDKDYPLALEEIGHGGVDFTIARLKDGTPTIRMGLPFVQSAPGVFSQVLVMELHQERLTALFAEATAYASYLVDRKGRVLGSTDPGHIPLGEDLSALPIVAGLATAKSQSGQADFRDKEGEAQIGAFQRVGFADLSVVSQVPLSRALNAQKQLYRRTGLLAGFFLCLALCLSFIFSQSLTGPIQALASAAEKVAKGEFSVRLKVKGTRKDPGRPDPNADEIQQFSTTFNQMVAGLEERDKVKATFAKFHSKEMAEKVLSGELKLGGERKEAAVFFSDVRGFTALSEGMDPEALVKVLNRYMTRMVHVILEHGGIVDKYVGDAIMAVWGVPMSQGDECLRAVRACLGMRLALAELNAELLAEGLPTLKIGMGLNFGPLVSGNIGSEERMEYTVIGDTVNTASRIESLTKEFGTDFLLSHEVLQKIEGKFVVEKAHEAKVKGKSEPLTVYKVHGYVDEGGAEVLVQTPYSSYTSEKSDKVVHDDKPKAAAPAADHATAPAPAAEHATAPAPAIPAEPPMADLFVPPAAPTGLTGVTTATCIPKAEAEESVAPELPGFDTWPEEKDWVEAVALRNPSDWAEAEERDNTGIGIPRPDFGVAELESAPELDLANAGGPLAVREPVRSIRLSEAMRALLSAGATATPRPMLQLEHSEARSLPAVPDAAAKGLPAPITVSASIRAGDAIPRALLERIAELVALAREQVPGFAELLPDEVLALPARAGQEQWPVALTAEDLEQARLRSEPHQAGVLDLREFRYRKLEREHRDLLREISDLKTLLACYEDLLEREKKVG